MSKETRFCRHAERVELTGGERDLGMGKQLEVIYTDGSTGWEHVEDLED